MRWSIEDTPERAAFREEFRGWLAENLPKGWMEAVDAGDDAALEQVRAGWNVLEWTRIIGESGYAAPLWPKEYGGLSGEVWMQQIIREELERYLLPTFGINILGIGLAGPTIIAHGTEEQKQRYLKNILTAEEVWCQLFSEPGAGSDLAATGTRAEWSDGEWIINGQKVWTSIAQMSKFGMLLARTDPDAPKHDGLTYFIVEMNAPGVEVRPLRQITGSAEFNEVYFTDVRVPDENRTGEVGRGWEVARTTLMNERVALAGLSMDAASMFGGARRDPWQSFLEGVRDRESAPNRQEIVRVYIEREVKEMTAFRANSARMRGATPGPEGSVGKVFNAKLNQHRSEFLMNAAGPAAIAWVPGDREAEGRASAFLRTRANSIEGGTSEVLRNQMAERVLGLPREPEVDRGVAYREIRKG